MKVDPVTLRQLSQWQSSVIFGGPVTSYRTFWQRQLPLMILAVDIVLRGRQLK
jgi:hypothetical protein